MLKKGWCPSLIVALAGMSCFRDDIVFLIYLYQRHIYPVDKESPVLFWLYCAVFQCTASMPISGCWCCCCAVSEECSMKTLPKLLTTRLRQRLRREEAEYFPARLVIIGCMPCVPECFWNPPRAAALKIGGQKRSMNATKRQSWP